MISLESPSGFFHMELWQGSFPWVWLTVLLQAAAMMWDDLYFHRRRTLPRWEIIGHPIDTFVFLGFLVYLLGIPPSDPLRLGGAIFLGACSCLVITKDEWVHSRYCEPLEQWLHALLFILHPIVVLLSFFTWPLWHSQSPWIGIPFLDSGARDHLLFFLPILSSLTGLFLFHQITLWILWPWLRDRFRDH